MSPNRTNENRYPLERQQQFMELYLPLRDRLVRFARTMARSEEDVEDLVGDTMLVALEGFERVRAPGAFLSYLFTIALRLHRRRTWRARLFGRLNDLDTETVAHTGSGPDAAADIAILRRALMRLPAKQRETITLFEISGLSLEEVRAVQGGSLSGVKSRLTRGRERLAELLTERDARDHVVEAAGTEASDVGIFLTNRGTPGND